MSNGSAVLSPGWQDFSFFIILSSLFGINGDASQTTYAAGNVFQEIFAKFRVAPGLPAASLDLRTVTGVGYAAEAGKSVLDNVAKLGTLSLGIEQVMTTWSSPFLVQLTVPRLTTANSSLVSRHTTPSRTLQS
jgi:hypothetical protein